MDRFDAMRLFVRLVERQSFTAAAADMGIPRSTASEVLRGLEARLGARLLERTTRHVTPTLDGEDYYRRCVAILAEVEEAEGAMRDSEPRGLLRIDANEARHHAFKRRSCRLARGVRSAVGEEGRSAAKGQGRRGVRVSKTQRQAGSCGDCKGLENGFAHNVPSLRRDYPLIARLRQALSRRTRA